MAGYFRIVVCAEEGVIVEAAERIARFVEAHRRPVV